MAPMVLYFSRNYNPRLAVAVARQLGAPVRFEFAQPFHPDHAAHFLAMNPNQSLPILLEGDKPWWEADAIACRLSRLMASDFWRSGDEEPEMIRWLSWGYWNFVRACDAVHFERVTKQRYGLGPVDQGRLAEGLREFHACAPILDAALRTGPWLLGDTVSYADFRLACVLPYGTDAGLPVADYPAIAAWNERLNSLPSWHDPFEGLDAPALPPIPG
jgi:glutathione S-transferase